MSPWIAEFAAVAGKSALLFAAGFGAAWATRRASAAVRHLVWTLTFGTVLVLPIATVVAPTWGVLPAGKAVQTVPSDLAGTAAPLETTAPTPSTAAEAPATASAPSPSGLVGRADPGSVASTEPADAPETTAPVAGIGSEVTSTGAAAAPPATTSGLSSRVGAAGFGFILILWLGGVAARLAILALGTARVSWLGRRARPLDAPAIERLMERVARELGLTQTPRVLVGEAAPVPLTWGIRSPRILLPCQALEWPEGRLRRVLLHEGAHIARRDLLAQWVAELACALHWFNPLAWAAVRRMRIEREHASDDAVLALGERPSDYASDLLDIVRGFDVPPVLAGAAAMARPSQLGDRMRAVLDPTIRRERTGVRARALSVLFAGGLLLGTAAAAPADPAETLAVTPAAASNAATEMTSPESERVLVGAERATEAFEGPLSSTLPPSVQEAEVCAYPREGEDHDEEYGVWHSEDGGRIRGTIIDNQRDDQLRLVWTGRACTVRIDTHPDVRFTEDESDVASLPRGAEFSVVHRTRDWTRELVIRADGTRSYRVDGRDAAIDDAVRDWTAGVVLTVLRRTGFQAEARADRILEDDGWPGLRREIEAISTSFVAARYLEVAFVGVSSDADRGAVMALASRRLDRDHAYAEFLKGVASRPRLAPDLRDRVIDGARDLDGDYSAGQVFGTLLEHQSLDAEELMAVIAAADAQIEGDYEMGRIYGALLEDENLDREGARRLVQSAGQRLDGDYALQELLIAVGARGDLGPWVLEEVLDATALLDGDYARREVLSTFVSRAQDAAALRRMLGEVDRLEGDHAKSEILREITQAPGWSGELWSDWLEVVEGIDGHTRTELTLDYLSAAALSAPLLERIIVTAREQGGHDGSRMLIAVAETGLVVDDLRELYLDAATAFGDYEEARILAALVRR